MFSAATQEHASAPYGRLVAATTLTLLLTVRVAVFVVAATVSAWIITCSSVVHTVSDAVRTASREGLQRRNRPHGRLHAYMPPPVPRMSRSLLMFVAHGGCRGRKGWDGGTVVVFPDLGVTPGLSRTAVWSVASGRLDAVS